MTYHDLAHFSETWGLLFLFILFVATLAYALWPANKERFDDAAAIPFREAQDSDDRTQNHE